ncbi:MAG: class I SAM-dependent methyltransferase [Bacteroidota bacterium]
MKKNINLENIKGSQATALMVLAPKAYYAKVVPQPDWLIDFSKAKEITDAIDISSYGEGLGSTRLGKKLSALGLAIRSRALEELLDKYLDRHPEAALVQFGCGLSDRSQRYQARIEAGLPFYDVDFPDMIDLRRNFYEESENYKMIASDLSNYTWIEAIPEEQRNRPFIFVAEGVSLYLSEKEIRDLFAFLKQHFPACIIILDTYSKRNLRLTGLYLKFKFNAQVKFSNDDPRKMLRWSKERAYKLLEEDVLLFRFDLMNNKFFPELGRAARKLMRSWFSRPNSLARSVVLLVFQLGEK